MSAVGIAVAGASLALAAQSLPYPVPTPSDQRPPPWTDPHPSEGWTYIGKEMRYQKLTKAQQKADAEGRSEIGTDQAVFVHRDIQRNGGVVRAWVWIELKEALPGLSFRSIVTLGEFNCMSATRRFTSTRFHTGPRLTGSAESAALWEPMFMNTAPWELSGKTLARVCDAHPDAQRPGSYVLEGIK